MLKSLELIGFKSFADRTRFDFAPGVTAVVGPNGSGKSNLVDAVRWLLGEQSAKSLRGGEMTDVIFNGSSTRKSLGMAEVTMTFDNAGRTLGTDADEVQLTRRVYRDGEGEYHINGRPSRLKDVKDLFLGSGAGHGAYGVIEQGRVDALLSAGAKDRRLVFEEAAGVSRFKAKKVECLRKLERVDADLIRVHDVLQELDKQLRGLRLQATKAQQYREYTTRQRELKVAAGRAEYASLTTALAADEMTLAGLRSELSDTTARTAIAEERLRTLDAELARTDADIRRLEGGLSEARQRIAAHESVVRAERLQSAALEADRLRAGRQRAELVVRTRVAEAEAGRLSSEVETVGLQVRAEQQRSEFAAAAVAAAAARAASLSLQAELDRDAQFDLLSRAARYQGDAETARGQVARLGVKLARTRADAEQAAARHDTLDRLLTDLSRSDADIRQRLADAQRALAEHQDARAALQRQIAACQHDLDVMKDERSTLRGRADVLEAWERNLDGIGAGVRSVLQWVRSGESPFAEAVFGIVADLIAAPRDVAPLIDLAVGDAAQRFVVRDGLAVDAVLARLGPLPGRVGFLPLSNYVGPPHPASAAALVRCDTPGAEGLPAQLLGHVLIVEDLSIARRIAPAAPGYRIVTRAGDVLEPDGAVTVGPVHAEAGLVSRKSELRDLLDRLAALDARVAASEATQENLRLEADQTAVSIRAREHEIAALDSKAGSLRDQIAEQRQVQRQLKESIDLFEHEAGVTETELAVAAATLTEAANRADAIEQETKSLNARRASTATELAAAEQDRAGKADEHTAAQVALARVSGQLAAAQKKRDEVAAELRQRKIDGMNAAAVERSVRGRLLDSQLVTLRATAAAAAAYADKEVCEHHLAAIAVRRADGLSAKTRIQLDLRKARESWGGRHDRLLALELAARDLVNRRQVVAERVRNECGIDLGDEPPTDIEIDQTAESNASVAQRVDPTVEIEDLRQKLARLGSVNLEALDELEAQEKREAELRTQFDDLTAARDKLQTITAQANADIRRLFTETLAAVRGHFQQLFRKLFAGGTADIVLEDESDVLESGIEIVARPPGKEPQRISLLSGGERALTAVALLLAIFRSRPSPFCILDEVDAAMDEANTQRLADILNDFSERSQFIVITHKKRTMAAAAVLHGVTMQESGVSKRVSIDFENWAEDAESDRVAA